MVTGTVAEPPATGSKTVSKQLHINYLVSLSHHLSMKLLTDDRGELRDARKGEEEDDQGRGDLVENLLRHLVS